MAKRIPVEVTPELVELFRIAVPAWIKKWSEVIDGSPPLTTEEFVEARDAVLAFDHAAGVRPWEHGPLSPHPDCHYGALREALIAKMPAVEVAQLRRFEARWWKHYDEECPSENN